MIKAIEVKPLAIPLHNDYHWRFGEDSSARLILFVVKDENGLCGYGEAVCEQLDIGAAYGRALSPFFLDRPVYETARIRHAIWSSGRWSVTPRTTNQTLAGLEVACWDLWGKTMGLSVCDLLGGRVREEVDFFGFVQGDDPETLGESAKRLKADGFKIFYVKAGRGDDEDRDAVAAVRDAIGPATRLRIDPNEAWDVPTAISQIRKLEQYDLDWVEQPVPGENVPGLAYVRRAVSTPIAADNAVYSVGELRGVLTSEAADSVVIALHETGGIERWRQMAHIADAFGIPVNRKGYLESDISTFASLQAMATVPNLTQGNQITHQLLSHGLTLMPIEINRGSVNVLHGPGLGFELNDAAVQEAHERYRSASTPA